MAGSVFRMPFKGDFSELPDLIPSCDKDVCVVGLFGQSHGNKHKAWCLNSVIGRTVFRTLDGNNQLSDEENDNSCYIECYHDEEERIVYLHLVSIHDVTTLIRLCRRMEHNMSHSECHEFRKSEENQHARALLYMFSICHIILVSQPLCRVNLSLVQLFRALESTRQKLLPLMLDELSVLPVSREWQNTGRMCTPRLLFVCQQSHLVSEDSYLDTEIDSRGSVKNKPRKRTPLLRLQHSLEDQIYRIFRKSRILTNNISHCLFSLPANQPYVHIISRSHSTTDTTDFLLSQINRSRNTGLNLSNYKHSRQSSKMSKVLAIDGVPQTEENGMTVGSLKAFLWEHVKLVHSHKAFDDNLHTSRSSSAPHFEMHLHYNMDEFIREDKEILNIWTEYCLQLYKAKHFLLLYCPNTEKNWKAEFEVYHLPRHFLPLLCRASVAIRDTLLTRRRLALQSLQLYIMNQFPNYTEWLEVSSKLYDFFLCDGEDKDQISHFGSLQSALDLDMRFSEARCAKVLPLATRTYQENASSHYTSIVHNTKLSQALLVYTQHARGPAYEKYAEQLQEECDIFWQNGRQLCEVVSLTGHHCTHKLHLLPDDIVDPEIDAILPRRPHTNNNHTPAACNCGRTVVQRDDPFDLKETNFEFFTGIEERCCGKLKHYNFKVYEPKRKDSKATILAETVIKESIPEGQASEATAKLPERVKYVSEQTGSLPATFSPALSLGQSGAGTGDALLSHDAAGGLPGYSSAGLLSVADHLLETVREKLLLGELDGSGYLLGMLCSISPRGLLPTFPSWSLVCLGKGSIYNPLKGLDQPGFLRDTNFLLPWDIPVPKGSTLDGHAWPSPSESGGGGRKGAKHRDKRTHKDAGSESSLRAYIGNEYECPRGHRYICSAPDKIVKATERSGVKETGNKLVTMDMPLYTPCACRASKPPLGQLMRIYVVTPDTSLYIKLNPRIRPGVHPCPVFYPEPKGEGLTLPRHTMWVLRFPYVYVDESGPILPPTDNQPPPGAKLMKGVYLTMLKPPET